MIRDRGMKKWQGMMLPEHTASLIEYFVEKKKVPKPELDEWELHAVEETLQIAIKRKCNVLLKIWEEGRLYIRGGTIAKVDLQLRVLVLDDPFGLHTFSLDNIIDVTASE